MKKIVIIDGTNLMFRSYYATAYTGNIMRSSKGTPTNALYGFVNMINKIIEEEKPKYMAIAFDIGTCFRHDLYKEYKAGRKNTPDELLEQLVLVKKLVDAMGIKRFEVSNYEADDIVGTIAEMANKDPEFDATLVTSDRDYLQLITDVVSVKLLKQKGYIRYNPASFFEEYGIKPESVTDLKGLMGDASDNILGIPGVGEKTALKLLGEYQTLECLYDHIDCIKGKLKDKLIENKEQAFFSKNLATIYKQVDLSCSLDDMVYNGPSDELNDLYRELEFYSLMDNFKVKEERPFTFKTLENLIEINLDKEIAYYIECDKENYHEANILGMGLYDGENAYFIEETRVLEVINYIKDIKKYTFDLKKNIVLLKSFDKNNIFDLSIASYLLNESHKDDLAILMNNKGINCPFITDLRKTHENLEETLAKKAKFIYDNYESYIISLKGEDMYELYKDIEHPLIFTLAKMEINGIKCDNTILSEIGVSLCTNIEKIKKEIFALTNHEFNVSSPKQLGIVLFEELNIPYPKKNDKTYKTGADILERIRGLHPIVDLVLEYRNLTKLESTYVCGLSKYIKSDGLIHTIYKQNITRTGRLSSVEPNMQNIPAKDEIGKHIRKAFLPTNDVFLSCDYSQIELRILAHISKSEELINAFKNNIDIHTFVAADIFDRDIKDVTPLERKKAKAVIFGIVYGISGFGLGENIGTSVNEAKDFIDKYFKLYPGVKEYMDLTIKDALESGYVRTLFKRKRNIDELFNPNFMIKKTGERMAMNTPIQGTSADIIKKAMVEIDEKLEARGLKSKMILQIHDELIFDCLNEELEEVKTLVTDIMTHTVNLTVPLEVSADIGADLYETK